MSDSNSNLLRLRTAALFVVLFLAGVWVIFGQTPLTLQSNRAPSEAKQLSSGCISCHGDTDASSMHTSGAVHISCVDCHGGKGDVMKPATGDPKSAAYLREGPAPSCDPPRAAQPDTPDR